MPHVEIPQAEFKVSVTVYIIETIHISYALTSFYHKKIHIQYIQVVILGDSHIGKTSLVTRFAEGYYRENSRPATESPRLYCFIIM